MTTQSAYKHTLDNVKVENNKLTKSGKTLITIGDEFTDSQNSYRSYKCTSIDLHYITFEKTSVGKFEENEIGKCQQFQTVNFIENELHLVKK